MLGACFLAFLTGAAVVAFLWIRSKLTYRSTEVHDSATKGNPEDAVIFYGWRSMPMPSGDTSLGASPFVNRLETWMRFANIKYKYVGVSDTSKAPKGQIPYIKHGSNTVGDTTFIIKYLQNTYGNPPPDGALMALTPQQQAISTLCSDMALERLAYLVFYHRFAVDSGWQQFKGLFSFLPKAVQMLLLPLARTKGYSRLFELGYARHSKSDVNKLLEDDLAALSTLLGDKAYLLSDAPCDADAALFAVLDLLVRGRTVSPEANAMVQQFPNLCQYCLRIHERFFPDKALTGDKEANSGKNL